MTENPDDPLSTVAPGEWRQFRYAIGESYLGDPVRIPVTVINGAHEGPSVFLTAGIHGDKLNGVKVGQEVAKRYDPGELHGRSSACTSATSLPTRPSSGIPRYTTRT